MRWFETPNFDFLGKRKVAYSLSGILFVASLAIILTKGLQYGIDFRGGKEFVYAFDSKRDESLIFVLPSMQNAHFGLCKVYQNQSKIMLKSCENSL